MKTKRETIAQEYIDNYAKNATYRIANDLYNESKRSIADTMIAN